MAKKNDDNVKIARNTIISYLRIICTTVFSLLTVRYLIASLGVERYGIYALVTGVITVLTFLNSAMTVSTQRYLSFYQGAGDKDKLGLVFKTSYILHMIIGLFFAIVLFMLMNPIVTHFINIDEVFISEARNLYFGVVVSVTISILTVPLNALLISHENFRVDALILMAKSLLMLLTSIFMCYIDESIRFIFLGAAISIISIFTFSFYFIYCSVNYEECNFKSPLVRDFSVEMATFALWNLYSNICYVLNTQGINVVINKFFGPKMNAAYGIAFQINGQVKNISQTLLSAMNPQIMKSEGKDNRKRTINVSIAASKVGFFLVALIITPFIFLLPDVIELWLGVMPEHVVMFTYFFFLANLINQLTIGISPAVQAVGDIKKFQVWIGSTAFLVLPISYVMLSFGAPIYFVMCLLVFVEIVTGYMKIHIFTELFGFSKKWYFSNVILKVALPFLIINIIAYRFLVYFHFYGDRVFVAIISCVVYVMSCYYFVLKNHERLALKATAYRLLNKIKSR